MLEKQSFTDLKNTLFGLLERYPEEMREIIMSDDDKTNVCAAAFFANEVGNLEHISPKERAEVILTYIESVWMAGFEAGYQRFGVNRSQLGDKSREDGVQPRPLT